VQIEVECAIITGVERGDAAMSRHNRLAHPNAAFLLVLFAFVGLVFGSRKAVERGGWEREEVNWHIGGGSRIKAVRYPRGGGPKTFNKYTRKQRRLRVKQVRVDESSDRLESVFASVIESPPVDGFVPWIVVALTNRNNGMEIDTVFSEVVVGDYLTNDPASNYAIGIFDTGASANLLSDIDALITGVYDAGDPDSDYVTEQPVELIGATGTATAYTSLNLGLFVGGLDALEPNGLLLDDSSLIGEYNVSVLAGDAVSSPNLPTAIGAPLSVFTCVSFCNNKQLSVTIGGQDFNSPYMNFYSLEDPCVPSYPSRIGLELRPSDAAAVQYVPCFEILGDYCPDGDGTPKYPSTIWGMLSSQSLYFIPRVDVADGAYSAPFNDKFMFDTGAQITVISEIVAAGLHLDTQNPDFTVEIQDVTGQVTIEPGFYLDSLVIPATNEWLEYENVPVIMLDVQSPEGGVLDGIIGMNLFVDLNFVFKGGGMMTQSYVPKIEFEHVCRVTGDIAGDCYECKVDYEDLNALADAWLSRYEPRTSSWNPNADLAPESGPDRKVDFFDYAVLANHWLEAAP